MVKVKICGITTPEQMQQATSAGADFIGLNFFPRSPRAVTPEQAGPLSRLKKSGVKTVALVVDADDLLLQKIIDNADIDLIQLHGAEGPGRAAEIRARFNRPIIKACPIADAADLRVAQAFEDCADYLLFDAKPKKKSALPGGNALCFDWSLLDGRTGTTPWILAGGLHPGNVAEAIRLTRAPCIDVASGVETQPGVKDHEKMVAFIRAAKGQR